MMRAADEVSIVGKKQADVELTAQSFQPIVELLQPSATDVIDISHEICYISSTVRHLLVDVMVTEDLVDYHRLD